MGDEVDLQKMFKELTGYEKNRVDLRIDGIPASPMQIVQAHVAREESAYMRDYVLNEKGDIKELWFRNLRIPRKKRENVEISNDVCRGFCYNKVE